MTVFICRGSYMDGVNIDVLRWCGLETLTYEEQDNLWEKTTEVGLFENCSSCDVEETLGTEEMPGQSDIFVKVVTSNLSQCKLEIRRKILAIIKGDKFDVILK